jgi:F-box protein 7
MDADMETCAEHDSATPRTTTTDAMAAAPTDDVASGSIPSILNRVLMAEHRKIRQVNDLLILAVHAVMLETGFVLVVQGLGHEAYSLGGRWTGGGDLDASYTVPNIREAANRSVGHVVLRSQTLGNNVIVYGTINNIMGGVGALQPVLRLVMKASKYLVGRSLPQDGGYIAMFSDPFALWKCVKDELSLPLLTAFCKEAGLPPPPSLLRLPVDLKVKILEGLPALDLARAGSVCSELRYLCANNELWKRLFVQEFGSSAAGHGPQSWKSEFARRYVERRRALERRPHHRPSWYGITPRFTPRFPSRRGIIGGDYDLYPSIGHGPFGGGMFGSGGASGSGGFLRSLHDRERSGQDMLGLTFPHDDSSFY